MVSLKEDKSGLKQEVFVFDHTCDSIDELKP